MSDIWLLRIGIVIAGVLLMAAIYVFGRPRKPDQGRKTRTGALAAQQRPPMHTDSPAYNDGALRIYDDVAPSQREVPADQVQSVSAGPELGKRDRDEFDKIVTLYVAARAGQLLHGPDIVVAAEKAGLNYGYMNIFHRLVEGRPDSGPVFSVANIKKPGGFEMAEIQLLQTPAIAFFLTLPAPIAALDAWEKMLPTAQRMAELLDGVVLDESRNALGRQRIAHIRDELRAYDRQHEAQPIGKNTRW